MSNSLLDHILPFIEAWPIASGAVSSMDFPCLARYITTCWIPWQIHRGGRANIVSQWWCAFSNPVDDLWHCCEGYFSKKTIVTMWPKKKGSFVSKLHHYALRKKRSSLAIVYHCQVTTAPCPPHFIYLSSLLYLPGIVYLFDLNSVVCLFCFVT